MSRRAINVEMFFDTIDFATQCVAVPLMECTLYFRITSLSAEY